MNKPKVYNSFQYMKLMPLKWGVLSPEDKVSYVECDAEAKVVEYIDGLIAAKAKKKSGNKAGPEEIMESISNDEREVLPPSEADVATIPVPV